MRGLYSSKTKIRHQIFTEIARMAYNGDDCKKLDELPYQIIPGEIASYRESIFLERAIVGERLRVAMGMSIRNVAEHSLISQGVEASVTEEKYYEPPLIDVIKFACHSCPEKNIMITNGCQGCLEHPCIEVCPKHAISMVNGRSVIDQDKCVKCGKCVESCPYNAIIRQERPCAKACGMDAIRSDENGRACIDHEKCVSCGMCLVSCPFSAIVDKGQIYQTILALKSDVPVYAIVAPAVAGQFGPEMKPEKIRPAFQALGFKDVVEVATGADLCAIEEAKDFMEEVPEKLPFMATSCCPAWSMMAKKMFPDYANCISMALTPMVLTARLIKRKHPDCKIVFVGPCAAKKLEASRRTIRSYVDFVLTFEELQGMFSAKNVVFGELPDGKPLKESSADGRGFAASGGVAKAVVNVIKRMDPEREVKVASAQGLKDCKKMLQAAKAGKYNGYLLEGMACPGGCIAGAGTIQPIKKSAVSLESMKKEVVFQECLDTKYGDLLEDLENFEYFAEEHQDENA
ncbi:MAG: 4Fe-4S dicluster domain-containing protein [Clostridiales bacterium]|nr:4Fe-4S dicluster domain-containing protein [Clostridiales bacterium]